jgi:spermidine synthase
MFFQILLLGGYAYAHLSAKLGPKKQFFVHAALLLATLVWLPIAAKTDLGFPSVEHPVSWVLLSLALSVGFPFFVLAANAPLLQFWLSRTNHKDAANPYFLYSASNVGSLLALISYPVVIEPLLSLQQQTGTWSLLFCFFGIMIVTCGYYMQRTLLPAAAQAASNTSVAAPTLKNRLYWIALAFCPSSLMLGVTTYVTTDIASVPLLWVIPLALYLLTFILAFAKKPMLIEPAMKAIPMLVPLVVMAMAFEFNFISEVILLHLFVFFYIALTCHGQLALNKPDAKYLTEFFLWVSFGGMLGGVFNSLIAPVLFTTPIEYPLILILSLFLRPPEGVFSKDKSNRNRDFIIPATFGLFLFIAFSAYGYASKEHADMLKSGNAWLMSMVGGTPSDNQSGLSIVSLLTVFLFVLFFNMSMRTSHRPVRFALTMAALLIAVQLTGSNPSGRILPNVIYAERNFFGVNRVLQSPILNARMLMHGTTLHGIQSLDPKLRMTPVSYYGPLRETFANVDSSLQNDPVALLGLGSGTITCFGKKDQPFDLYEIDPIVASIASNPEYFTFLRDCGPKTNIIMGDARLSLNHAQDKRYGVIVIDVFSSDAIPVHLLTKEALELYKSKLKDGGMIMFNISNRHLKLAPVMAALSEAVGLKARIKHTTSLKTINDKPSIWVIMAREDKDFNQLAAPDSAWKPLEKNPSVGIWTDNYSNIMQTIF